MDTRYNGWTNYETWVANLWMDNDEGSYNYWQERAEAAAADALGDTLTEKRSEATALLAAEMEAEMDEAVNSVAVTGVLADLLNRAAGCIDWREIADHRIADLDADAFGEEAEEAEGGAA